VDVIFLMKLHRSACDLCSKKKYVTKRDGCRVFMIWMILWHVSFKKL